MKDLILASVSPRRKEILEKTGLSFRMADSDFEEKMNSTLDPIKQAEIFSLEKAKAVAAKNPGAIVIGADTIVVFNNQKLGKPKSEEEARQMLSQLSGKTNLIVTAYSVIDSDTWKTVTKHTEVKVCFRNLSSEEIAAYIKTGEPMDKAGAYAIQGLGAILIEKVEGDFLGAMGLPLSDLAVTLKEFGITVLG